MFSNLPDSVSFVPIYFIFEVIRQKTQLNNFYFYRSVLYRKYNEQETQNKIISAVILGNV